MHQSYYLQKYYNNNNPVAQQPITGPGPPHYEVSRSCGRTPWASDQLNTM
jgi:hypothetical protein